MELTLSLPQVFNVNPNKFMPREGLRSDLPSSRAALFLASDASRFVTGQNLVVDGGISAGWPIAAARRDRELLFRTIQASVSAHSA